jgi:hypothetical protein
VRVRYITCGARTSRANAAAATVSDAKECTKREARLRREGLGLLVTGARAN